MISTEWQLLFLFELVTFLFVIRFIRDKYETCRVEIYIRVTNPNRAREIIKVISKFHITCKYISAQYVPSGNLMMRRNVFHCVSTLSRNNKIEVGLACLSSTEFL